MARLGKFFSALTIMLAGCGSHEPQDYAQEKPILDIKTYFNGTVNAWGMFQDYTGKVVKRFKVIMTCEWKGNNGKLHEVFTYDDGSHQSRTWHFVFTDDHHFKGTAEDVVGEAQGEMYGNAMRMFYRLKVPVEGKIQEFDFEDWMFKVDDKDHIVVNRAKMKKFGFTVGELSVFFQKEQK